MKRFVHIGYFNGVEDIKSIITSAMFGNILASRLALNWYANGFGNFHSVDDGEVFEEIILAFSPMCFHHVLDGVEYFVKLDTKGGITEDSFIDIFRIVKLVN